MVGAAVAERQLEGLQADGAAEQLVAEADAPHGLDADELAHRVDDVVQRRRVAGAVGEEDGVGVVGEQLLARELVHGMQRHARAARDELAHHRGLDAGVDHRDPRAVAVLAVVADLLRA